MADRLADLSASPCLYPQKLDLAADTVFLVTMGEADYRRASFLDDRILTPRTDGRWESLAAVAAAMASPARPCPLHFIFHSGHVGSTLLSRLLDEVPGVLSLREPVPLRDLAEAQDAAMPSLDDRLEILLRLWERGFAETKTVMLKATSSAARLAPRLLTARPQARAIYLNLPAEPYLATLLAGPNSPIDLNWHGAGRLLRFKDLLGETPPSLEAMSLGELAALSWLVERLTQKSASERFASRILALDFGHLLDAPADAMAAVLRHLGIAAPDGYLNSIARSAVLTRYSKAPEYEYSARLRAELLDEARRDHADELRRGLRFLESLGARHGSVADVLML